MVFERCFATRPPCESLSSLVRQKLIREHDVLGPASEEQVEMISLDEYCETSAIKRIDLLKLDAEGAEPEVLPGRIICCPREGSERSSLKWERKSHKSWIA